MQSCQLSNLRENYQKIARFCCWNIFQQFCCWNTFQQQHCWNIFEECCCWKLVFHKCPRLHCCPGNFISRANWKPSDKLFIKLSSNFPLSKVTLVNALVGGALAKRRVALRSTCCKLEQTKSVASTRETPNLVFSIYFGTTWLILENAMGLCSNSILHDQGCVVSEQECIMQKQCIMQKAIQSCLRERGSLGNISIWQLFSVVSSPLG